MDERFEDGVEDRAEEGENDGLLEDSDGLIETNIEGFPDGRRECNTEGDAVSATALTFPISMNSRTAGESPYQPVMTSCTVAHS